MSAALSSLSAWIDLAVPAADPSHLSHQTGKRWEDQPSDCKDFPTFPTFPTADDGFAKTDLATSCACGCGHAGACEGARSTSFSGKSGKVGNIENTDTYGWERSGKNPPKVGKVGNPYAVRTYEDEDRQALFDERAAILEYLGGHDRPTAERLAREELSLLPVEDPAC